MCASGVPSVMHVAVLRGWGGKGVSVLLLGGEAQCLVKRHGYMRRWSGGAAVSPSCPLSPCLHFPLDRKSVV